MINPATHIISMFAIPIPDSNPGDITTGPDGNLLVHRLECRPGRDLQSDDARLHRVRPWAKAVTALTTGPDGNIWFTASDNQVGMIDPTTGTITSFSTPTADSNPAAITTGPDGNLWFTETGADQIGTINPATQVVSEFAVPVPGMFPDAITAGPDGNLWFTETGDQVGTISPATHVITEFPIPTTATGARGHRGRTRRKPLAHRRPGHRARVDPNRTSATTTALSFSAADGTYTFTATVTPASGSGTPTGAVAFTIDGVAANQFPALMVVDGQDIATFSPAVLGNGPHTVSVTYAGDETFGASAASLPLTVTAAPLASTLTTLSSSTNLASANPTVTFTATVQAVAAQRRSHRHRPVHDQRRRPVRRGAGGGSRAGYRHDHGTAGPGHHDRWRDLQRQRRLRSQHGRASDPGRSAGFDHDHAQRLGQSIDDGSDGHDHRKRRFHDQLRHAHRHGDVLDQRQAPRRPPSRWRSSPARISPCCPTCWSAPAP